MKTDAQRQAKYQRGRRRTETRVTLWLPNDPELCVCLTNGIPENRRDRRFDPARHC